MADDYAGSVSTLGVLTAGGSVQGNFEKAGDRDLFKIALRQGVTYQFVLSGAAGGGGTLEFNPSSIYDISLGVFNQATNTTQYLAYTGGPGGLPSAPFTPTADGDYFVAAFGYGVGTYTLSAAIISTDDVGNTVDRAGTVAVGQSVDGSIGAVNDRDWFKVELGKGMVTMALADRNGSPGMHSLALYDAAGVFVHPGEGVPAGAGVYSLTQLVPATGIYYVQVRSNVSAGDYTLSLSTPEDDIGASSTTASTLAVGQSASGLINYLGDADWFKADLEAGVLYSFSSESLAGVAAPALSVYGATGAALWNGSGSFAVAKSGSYYLQATGTATGAYRVTAATLTDDAGATAETAGVLPRGFTVTGRYDAPNDQDWYRLQLEEGRFYQIDARFAATTVLPGRLPYIRLPNEDAAPFSLLSHDGPTGTDKVVMRATATGEIMVRMGMDQVADYRLFVSDLGPDDAADSAAKALLQSGSTPVNGTIELIYDVDVYKFQLAAGVTYQFTGSGALVPAGGNSQLALSTDGGYGSYANHNPVVRITPQTTGEYAIHARGYAVGAYTITMSQPVDDFGANAGQAGMLAIGASSAGENNSYEDRDWFALDLTAGQTYWFDATFGSYAHPPVRVRAADGTVLAQSASSYSDGKLPTISFAAETTGKYYLEVGGTTAGTSSGSAAGKYTVAARAGVADDHVAVMDLALGQTETGRFEIASDGDSFRFDLLKGSYYKLVYQQYDATGKQVVDSTQQYFFGAGSGFSYIRTSNDGNWITPNSSSLHTFTAKPSYAAASTSSPAVSYSVRLEALGADDQWEYAPRTLELGVPPAGNFEANRDKDVFGLSLVAGQKIDVSLSGRGAITIDSYVPAAVVGSDGSEHLVFTAPTTGAFRIGVQGAQGAYQIHAIDMSADTTAPTLLNPSQTIDYRTPVVLKFSEPILWVGEIRVLDSAGSHFTTLAESSTVGDSASFTVRSMLPGQTYKLSVPTVGFVDHAGLRYAGSTAITVTVAESTGPTAGNDVFVARINGATINGGAGLDTVVMSYSTSSLTFSRPAADTILVGAHGSVKDTLVGIERLYGYSNWAMAFDTAKGEVAGSAYRLYRAAFDRSPDDAGVGFWISAMDGGMSLKAVAEGFVGSAEFIALYGANPSSRDVVSRLYLNVLDRAGEQAGIDFWSAALDNGASLADVLAGFSESKENIDALAAIIGNGFDFIPY